MPVEGLNIGVHVSLNVKRILIAIFYLTNYFGQFLWTFANQVTVVVKAAK